MFETEISGAFPSVVGLSNLKELDLTSTGLTGTLPVNDWNTLGQLEILDLSSVSGLYGALPQSLRSLTCLRVFNIEFTRLSGYFEDIFGNMATTLGKWKAVLCMSRVDNSITSYLTCCFFQEIFHAAHSVFKGHIPTTVGSLTNLSK